MASHEVRIGSKVHSNDNKTIGEVHRLVIDPNTRLVSTLIVGNRFGPERLVDIELIEKSDKDAVWLSIPEYRADTLPPFVHETVTQVSDWRNIAFGAGPTTSMGSVSGPVAYAPGSYSQPVSQPFFSTAPIGNVVTTTIEDIADTSTTIGKGTEVRGSDGKSIGHVHEIVFGDNDEVTGLLVQSGHIFHKDTEIPISAIDYLGHDHVRLNVSSDEAKSHFEK